MPPSWSSPGSSAGTSTPTGPSSGLGGVLRSVCGCTKPPSALDSLAQIGFRTGDPGITRGVAGFTGNQDPSGLWNTGRNRPKGPHSDLWVGLAICRMLNAVSA